jgi:hypothetical protein
MFGFFKRNNNVKREVSTASPEVASPVVASPVVASPVVASPVVASPVVAQKSLKELIEIVNKEWTSNAQCSVFFAQCGGFDHQIIGGREENVIRFTEIIQQGDPNNFTGRDKAKALKFYEIEAPTEFKKFYNEFSSEELAQAMFELAISKRESDLQQLEEKVDEKFEFIGPIFQRLLNSSVDKYGELDFGPLFNETQDFIDRFFTDDDFDFFYRFRPLFELLTYIEGKLEREADGQSAPIPLDGIEFEHWTANELSQQGWQVQVSQASGDQGVDVMARREGLSVAIQCKRYSKPVGNKAVQEVFAAKQFASADHACVIGTGGFTRSARELAGATGVVLLEAEAGLQAFSSSFGFDPQMLEVNEAEDVAMEFNFDANNEAKKAIIKACFMCPDDDCQIPDVLLDNFDQETGSGSATLVAGELFSLLVYADIYLSGVAAFTDEVREKFRSSDTLWHQELANDENIQSIAGIFVFGSTTPEEIKEEFCLFWSLCEQLAVFDSEKPHRQALNELYRYKIEEFRPTILDVDY